MHFIILGLQQTNNREGKAMKYVNLYRLTKDDLKDIITSQYPHLRGSLYKCSKRDLVSEIKNRKMFD